MKTLTGTAQTYYIPRRCLLAKNLYCCSAFVCDRKTTTASINDFSNSKRGAMENATESKPSQGRSHCVCRSWNPSHRATVFVSTASAELLPGSKQAKTFTEMDLATGFLGLAFGADIQSGSSGDRIVRFANPMRVYVPESIQTIPRGLFTSVYSKSSSASCRSLTLVFPRPTVIPRSHTFDQANRPSCDAGNKIRGKYGKTVHEPNGAAMHHPGTINDVRSHFARRCLYH